MIQPVSGIARMQGIERPVRCMARRRLPMACSWREGPGGLCVSRQSSRMTARPSTVTPIDLCRLISGRTFSSPAASQMLGRSRFTTMPTAMIQCRAIAIPLYFLTMDVPEPSRKSCQFFPYLPHKRNSAVQVATAKGCAMPSLETILHAQSPRFTPRPIPLVSRLISIFAPLLFVVLTAQAFYRNGLGMWSVGIAYILYDTSLLLFTAWQIRKLVEDVAAPAPAGPRPTLGVIVAAHNEASVIRLTIDRLLAQAEEPEAILIADDGSSDEHARRPCWRATALPPPRSAALRKPPSATPACNGCACPMAVRPARSTRHCSAATPMSCLPSMPIHCSNRARLPRCAAPSCAIPALVAATGVLVPICGPSLSGRLFEWFQSYEYVRNFLSRDAWMQLNGLLLISGAFAAFRRDAVFAVGGFDPDCMVEDYELIHRLHRHSHDHGLGWHVAVVGGALRSHRCARQRFAASSSSASAGSAASCRRSTGTATWWGTQPTACSARGCCRCKALDTLQPIYGLAAFAILIWLVATGRFYAGAPDPDRDGRQDRGGSHVPPLVARHLQTLDRTARRPAPRPRADRRASPSRSASSCCAMPVRCYRLVRHSSPAARPGPARRGTALEHQA